MNEEIAEGIKFAMSKGETLQQAMQSFYNAGYPKQEVEEAARSLQYQLHVESEKGIHAVHPDFSSAPKNAIQGSPDAERTGSVQKVSSYDSHVEEENPRRKMIILVSTLLVVLAIVFAGIFFFKDYLLQLFGKILG